MWGTIKAVTSDAWHWLYDNVLQPIEDAFSDVVNWIESHWELLTEILVAPIAPVLALFLAFHDQIIGFFEDIWANIQAGIDDVVGFFTALPGRIVAGLGDVVSTIWAPFSTAATWVDTNVIKPVVSTFTTLPSEIVSGLGNIVGTIFSGLSGAWTWIKTNVYNPIVGGFTGLPKDIASAIGGAIGDLGSIATSIINAIIGGMDSAITFYNSHRPSILGVSLLPAGPLIPKLASGGIIPAIPGRFYIKVRAARTRSSLRSAR